MEFSAQQIAKILNGRIVGDPNATVTNLSRIEEGGKGTLSFLSKPQYQHYIYETAATVVVVSEELQLEKPVKDTCTLIYVANAREAFSQLLALYMQIHEKKSGIHPSAVVSSTARIGADVYIGPNVSIGENSSIGRNCKIHPGVVIEDNVSIGENTSLYSNVSVYHSTCIGNHCTIHAGTIIGGDGFGFEPNKENTYNKIPHIGNVIIEDHVEIGCNTTIDRATLGSTIIRKGVKLDNLIQVAHNVEIGENTVIASQTGIAGSTKIGRNCLIGGQVGIVGHIHIADGVKIAAQSGIGQSITKENEIVQGSPAFPIGDYKRSFILFKNLPDLNFRIKELENLVKELKMLQEK